MLNWITHWFLNRAYTQMEATGELQNADDVADFCDDYFTTFVKQLLTNWKNCVTLIT